MGIAIIKPEEKNWIFFFWWKKKEEENRIKFGEYPSKKKVSPSS